MKSEIIKLAANVDNLLPRPGESTGDNNIVNKYSDLKAIGDLPELTQSTLMADIIKIILSISMALTTIALVVAGIYYLISQGQDEELTKAKNIILYLVIGLAIMAGAYGIISGIAQFEFF